MAGCAIAELIDHQDDSFVIAVQSDFAHGLKVSRLFAFAPQFFPAARVVAGAARSDGFSEGLGIHISDHEHALAFEVLGDDWHDAAISLEIYFGNSILHDGVAGT